MSLWKWVLSLVYQQVSPDLGTLLQVSGLSEMITHIPRGDRRCKRIRVIQGAECYGGDVRVGTKC